MVHIIGKVLALCCILVFECSGNSDAGYGTSELEPQNILADRNLQSLTPKLKIKLTNSQYTSQTHLVVLQDPCILSTSLICIRNPAYIQTQISQPIKVPLSSSTPGSELVYEYSGYYLYPITLDIYYHTAATFTLKRYSSLNLTGGFTQSTINSVYFSGSEGSTSSFHVYGYIKGPIDGNIPFSIYQDDGAQAWINGDSVHSNPSWGTRAFNCSIIKDLLYYVEVIVNNSFGGGYGLELKWNLSGSYIQVDSSYMTNPVRVAGMPYLLDGLKYNTYCDDVNGFRCIVCDGLCIDCAENSSQKVCTTCKPNSEISAGNCVCKSRFYLSGESCLPCAAFCDSCETVNGNYRCNTCTNNASLDISSNSCSCNDEHYSSSLGECIACNPLCSSCEERSGSQVCLSCKEFAILISGECACMEGYYKKYYDTNPSRCYECPERCFTCDEDNNGVYCNRCKEGLVLKEGRCECMESNYYYDEIEYECKPCDGLCSACNNLACIGCVENAELRNGECYCNDLYYHSITDPYACSLCMNENCKTCEEKEGSYECTSCIYPYILSDSKECICDLEDCTITDGGCIPREFIMILNPSTNLLKLNFNKLLIRGFTLSDLSHTISQQDLLPSISTSLITIEERLRYEISYQSSDPIDTTISITLKAPNIIQDRQLQYLSRSYYEASVPILYMVEPNTSTTEEHEESEEYEDSEDCKDTNSLEYKTALTLIVSCCILIAVSLLNRNLKPVWNVLNLIQILKFSALLNIELPCNLQAIAQGMRIKFIPNIFEYFMTYESNSTPRRYEDMGFDTTIYLLNSRDLLTILIINIGFYLLFKLMHYMLRKRDSRLLSIAKKVIVGYEWSFYARFMIQGYLDIAVASSFTLKYLPRDIEIPDYISAVFSFVLICLFPILVFRFLYRKYEFLENDELVSKWGSLYTEYDYKKSRAASYFTVVFLSRRLIYSIAINYLDFNPIIQLGLCYSSSVFVIFTQYLFYLIYFRPYEDKLDQNFQILIELMILVYFILLNIYIFDTSGKVQDIIEWVCIGIMIGSVLILTILSISRSFYQLINKVRQVRRSAKIGNQIKIKNYCNQTQSNIDQTHNIDTSFESSQPTNVFNKFYTSLSIKERRIHQENYTS